MTVTCRHHKTQNERESNRLNFNSITIIWNVSNTKTWHEFNHLLWNKVAKKKCSVKNGNPSIYPTLVTKTILTNFKNNNKIFLANVPTAHIHCQKLFERIMQMCKRHSLTGQIVIRIWNNWTLSFSHLILIVIETVFVVIGYPAKFYATLKFDMQRIRIVCSTKTSHRQRLLSI